MTADEAIELAHRVAIDEVWVWKDPIHVKMKQESHLSASIVWEVRSNARSRGCNVVVRINDQTGEVVGKAFWPR